MGDFVGIHGKEYEPGEKLSMCDLGKELKGHSIHAAELLVWSHSNASKAVADQFLKVVFERTGEYLTHNDECEQCRNAGGF